MGESYCEHLWNKFAVEDDQQKKKLWLDIFLCRALAWDSKDVCCLDKFLFTQTARSLVVPTLIAELKLEIGSFCSSSLAAEDLEQLRTYVYGGRGWKLLRVLDVILSSSSTDPPFLPDEEGKEFVDLLISLYQLSVFPLSSASSQGRSNSKAPLPEQKCEKDSVSALDLWHETLMTVASVEHEIVHDFNSEPYLAGGSVFPRTLALWQQLSEEEAKQNKGLNFGAMTKRQKKKAAETLLRGFTTTANNSSMQTSFRVSNLFSYERRSASGARLSSDSETAEVEGLLRQKRKKLPPHVKNPMDFDFFDRVVRSENEATNQIEWERLKGKLINAPVTSKVALEDARQQASDDVDLHRYLEPRHIKSMFAKLSEVQLSNLVIRLMCTICCVEIRWTLRQRKTQAPLLSPSQLYLMSYPLVQFASDTLSSVRGAANNITLQINLVGLLLSALADVTIFCDIPSVHELFFHHKVLFKCLDVARDTVNVSSVGLELKLQLITCLLRPFRITLQKHTNTKLLGDLKDGHRAKKEDLVKQTCTWFCQSNGMAQTLISFVLKSETFIESDEDLVRTFFHEIGLIVQVVGLCPNPSVNRNAEDSSSYNILKETRAAVYSVYCAILRIFPAIAKTSNGGKTDYVLKCLSKSACIHPYTACSSALKVLDSPSPPIEKIFDYLAKAHHHCYLKHSRKQNQAQLVESINASTHDSDSAFCASDSSSMVEQDHDGKDGYRCIADQWNLYTKAILTNSAQASKLLLHVEKLVTALTEEGRFDIFLRIIAPLLEALPCLDDDENEPLIWAMRMCQFLSRDALVMQYLTSHQEKYKAILTILINACTKNINCNIGHISTMCLKSLTLGELGVVRRPIRKVSQEEGLATSDEEATITTSSEKNQRNAMSMASSVQIMVDMLKKSDKMLANDIGLWNIQRDLIRECGKYGSYFIQKGLHVNFSNYCRLSSLTKRSDADLTVAVLQILSLLETHVDEASSSTYSDAKHAILGNLMDDVCKDGAFDLKKALRLVSIFLASDIVSSKSQESECAPQRYFDGYDADDECDLEACSKQISSDFLISTDGHEKVMQLLTILVKKTRTEQIDQLFLYCFSKIVPTLKTYYEDLAFLHFGKVALEVVKDGLDKSMVESAIALCQIYMLSTPITKQDMAAFIDVVKQVDDTDVMNSLMTMFNVVVASGWSASKSPFNCLVFPCERSETNYEFFTRNAWATFHLPPSSESKIPDFLKNSAFCVSAWISVSSPSSHKQSIHLVSIGSRRLMLEVWICARTLTVNVTTELQGNCHGQHKGPLGAITFLNLLETTESWQNVTLNCCVNNLDLLHVEALVNGKVFKGLNVPSQVSLRSLIPSNVCLTERDTTRTIHIGEQRGARRGDSSLMYSHVWVFSSCVTKDQALFLYLLGPTVTSFDQMKAEHSMLHSPRLHLVKRVLLRDPTCAPTIERFQNSGLSEEFQMLRQCLLVSHVSTMGAHMLYYPQSDAPSGSKSLIASLLNVAQRSTASKEKTDTLVDGPTVLTASTDEEEKRPCDCKELDLYSGSWCSAVEENGGFGMLLLLLARNVEIGCSDACLSIVLDALLTALEAASHSFIREAAHFEAFVLIKKVLSSGKSKLGLSFLKVLIDHTFTQSLLECDERRGRRFSFQSNFSGIVYHHDCLNLMINCWKLWNNDRNEESFSATEAMLASLVAVLQDSHIFRDVNIEILRKLGIIKRLAFAIKAENIDEDRQPASNSHVVPSIIEIFSALVGSPPDLTVVSELMQVALFLHDSTNTYVHHSKNSFYFTLPSIMNTAASMTWPRASSSVRHRNSKALSKSASFTVNKSFSSYGDEEADFPNKPTIEVVPSEESPPNPSKLNPDRLRKIISSNKRHHHYMKRLTSTESQDHEAGIVHFGHISRLENKPNSPVTEGLDVMFPSSGNQDQPSEAPDCDDSDGEAFHHDVGAIEGILNILHGALVNMPDSSVAAAMTTVILPEYILTLVNHPDPFVRLSATRVMSKYVHRTCRLYPNGYRVDKIEGYHLLAAQLFTWGVKPVPGPVIDRLASSILSLVHGVEIYCTSRIPELPVRGAKVRSSALPPLLAMLPNLAGAGSGHLSTTHSLVVHLHDIIARVHNFLRLEHEPLGIFETLCRTVECLMSSPLELWTSDIVGQDGREIIWEDLDYLLRFIGMHFASAQGVDNFRSLETLMNMLVHMAHFHDTQQPPSKKHSDVSTAFRKLAANVLTDCITDLLERIQKIDKQRGSFIDSRSFAQFAGNGETGMAGEEVTELLMRSLVDDHNVMMIQVTRPPPPPSSTYSSAKSFSFKGDALRAHSNVHTEGVKVAGRSDLGDRLNHLVDFGVEMCLLMPHDALHKDFLVSLMGLLMTQLQASTRLMPVNFCRAKLMALTVFSVHHLVPLQDRLYILKALHQHQPHWAKLFQRLVFMECPADQGTIYRHFVARLALDREQASREVNPDDDDYDGPSSSSSDLTSLMEAVNCFEPQTASKDDDDGAVKKYLSQLAANRRSFVRRCEISIIRLLRQHDEKIATVAAKAIHVTEAAMAAQDSIRKQYLIGLRDQLACEMNTRHTLTQIIASMTHERAPWFVPCSNGSDCWKLDETEGAQRMRIRLCRSKKSLDKKFYLQEGQPSPDSRSEIMPFEFLLRPSHADVSPSKSSSSSGMAGILVAQLSSKSSTSVKHMEQCWLVIPAGEVSGEILLTEESLHFVQHGEIDPKPLYKDSYLPLTLSMALDQIREVLPRRYQLNDCALELFFDIGFTRFLAFADAKTRDAFLARLVALNPQWDISEDTLEKVLRMHTGQWQAGNMTNFDYLVQLNKFAGRTFCDLMQYPIFPFVLSDYSSPTIDLTSLKSFRDLRKPVSVQRPEKEEHYRANYEALSDDLQKSHELTCPGVGPFHYGSHYSNTGIVLHFLVRLSPFTAMFLKYQDGNFDIPDRTFHDMGSTWRLASGDSTTDVKELIPELFYLPEILTNDDRLDLGVKQNGQRVDHVNLPPWANGDPRIFVKIHRQALESDYVRENLHHWIDLIFGFKQSGSAAVDAINVFHPATYYGFDLQSIKDPVQRKARATMIKTYGQTPKQLFSRPHPMAQKTHLTVRRLSQLSTMDNPVETCIGLRLGNIVGLARPTKVFADLSHRVSLTSVSHDRVFGLKPGSLALIKFAQSFNHGQAEPLPAGTCIVHLDPLTGWAKAWLKKGERPQPLLPLKAVSCMASVPGMSTFWVGHSSGMLQAVTFSFDTKSLQLVLNQIMSAFGHAASINDIAASREWGIVVTAASDGSCVVWDARKLAYIRTIRPASEDKVHKLVRVSKTSGDIAIVTEAGDSSCCNLFLYTINGRQVAVQNGVEPPISALDFSCETEGIAVNTIATGHAHTGVIRLWSSWDLRPMRDLDCGHPNAAVLSVLFSADSRHLYASFEDGYLVIFERPETGLLMQSRQPNYLDLSQVVTD